MNILTSVLSTHTLSGDLRCLANGAVLTNASNGGGRAIVSTTEPARWHVETGQIATASDCVAARLLRDIESGRVGKRDIEVVIARHEEDIGWASPYQPITTVYDKSRAPLPGAIALPNWGREQHSFMKHVVDQYDSLADHTVFPTCAGPTTRKHSTACVTHSTHHPRYSSMGRSHPSASFFAGVARATTCLQTCPHMTTLLRVTMCSCLSPLSSMST